MPEETSYFEACKNFRLTQINHNKRSKIGQVNKNKINSE